MTTARPAPAQTSDRSRAARRLRPAVAMLAALPLLACGGGDGSAASGSPSAGGNAGTQRPGSSSAAPSTSGNTSSASPTSSADAVTACASSVVDGLDPAARVGQLLMVGLPATTTPDATPATLGLLRSRGVGGVFLSGRSTAGVKATRALTDRVRDAAAAGPGAAAGALVATDQEGGQVQVLRGPGFSTIPSAVAQADLGASALKQRWTSWAGELGAAGVDLNLAPVADSVPASIGTSNMPIGRYKRQYGATGAEAAPAVAAVVAGHEAAEVGTTVKHFPGLGRVRGNTDTTADVHDTATTRDSAGLASFRAGLEAGAPALMMSSAIYDRIDPASPAVFSSTVVTGMVRGDLGFDGLVLTDDVGAAVAVSNVAPGDRAVRAVRAGVDVVLTVDPAVAPAMLDALAAAAAKDPAMAERIRASAVRVVAAKIDAGRVTCEQ